MGAVLAALGLCAGCAAPAPVVQAAASEASSAEGSSHTPRRPDGVVLEPATAMPSAATEAEARGVVTLRPTLSAEAVQACVEELLDAWQHGSLDALMALLAPDAGPLEGRARGPSTLIESFRQRLRAHEYKHLEGIELARVDRVEHYTWSELAGPESAGAQGSARTPARPEGMRPDEIYVRIPLEVSQVAGEKFFEPTIVLLLRAEHARARITVYGEIP